MGFKFYGVVNLGAVFILCCAFVSPAWGGDEPILEDAGGNLIVAPPAGAYVYSGPGGALDASRAGESLAGAGIGGIVAIADVRGLGWPPISSIVRGAVAEQGRRDGTPVLLDWTGAWGNMMGLASGGCSVVIMDGENVVSTSSCAAVIGSSPR